MKSLLSLKNHASGLSLLVSSGRLIPLRVIGILYLNIILLSLCNSLIPLMISLRTASCLGVYQDRLVKQPFNLCISESFWFLEQIWQNPLSRPWLFLWRISPVGRLLTLLKIVNLASESLIGYLHCVKKKLDTFEFVSVWNVCPFNSRFLSSVLCLDHMSWLSLSRVDIGLTSSFGPFKRTSPNESVLSSSVVRWIRRSCRLFIALVNSVLLDCLLVCLMEPLSSNAIFIYGLFGSLMISLYSVSSFIICSKNFLTVGSLELIIVMRLRILSIWLLSHRLWRSRPPSFQFV